MRGTLVAIYMRHILKIILLLSTFNSFGQTSINNVSLDSLGLLSWNITYMIPNLRIEIQRNLGGKWTTIFRTGQEINYIQKDGEVNIPPTPTPTTIADSCIVPLDKGLNRYRIIMTVPSKLESKEVSVKLLSNSNKHALYAKDNYISFDKGVLFWIYDSNGKEIRKLDSGRMINTTELKKGLYYIIIYPNIYEFDKK